MTVGVRLQGCLGLAMVCAASCLFGEDGKVGAPSTSATNAVVELKGKLVRISEKTSELGLRTEQGMVYTLVSNHMSSALFIDTNFFGRTLVLKGRELSNERRFEVTGNWRSFRGDRIHNLYYYCEVCAVEGIDSGPCLCCRDPVHLVEEPPK
jgi:hypothetical protein